MAFSPDGMRIVSGSDDNTVRLWDAASGAQLAVLRGHEDEVNSVAFSPDGTRIVTGGGDTFINLPGEVKVWDAQKGGKPLLAAAGTRSPRPAPASGGAP